MMAGNVDDRCPRGGFKKVKPFGLKFRAVIDDHIDWQPPVEADTFANQRN